MISLAAVSWGRSRRNPRFGSRSPRGRPTEVKAQLTPVTAIAARHGLETPLLLRLIEMIEEIESGERLLTLENLPELEYALLPPEDEDESDDEAGDGL